MSLVETLKFDFADNVTATKSSGVVDKSLVSNPCSLQPVGQGGIVSGGLDGKQCLACAGAGFRFGVTNPISTNDFELNLVFRPKSYIGGAYVKLLNIGTINSAGNLGIVKTSSSNPMGVTIFLYNGSGGSYFLLSTPYTISTDDFHALKLSRVGSLWTLVIDSNEPVSVTLDSSHSGFNLSSTDGYLGNNNYGSEPMLVDIDSFSIKTPVLNTLSGSINLTSALDKFRVSVIDSAANQKVGELVTTSKGAYSVDCVDSGSGVYSIDCTPYFDYVWSVSKVSIVGDIVSPTNPATNPRLYICTTAGTNNETEPTWPASGTVTSGSCTWAMVDVIPAVQSLFARLPNSSGNDFEDIGGGGGGSIIFKMIGVTDDGEQVFWWTTDKTASPTSTVPSLDGRALIFVAEM